MQEVGQNMTATHSIGPRHKRSDGKQARSGRLERSQMSDLWPARTPVDDHEVHATGQSADCVIGLQLCAQSGQRTVETADLGAVDALLRRTKGHCPETAHLDHDERGRWPGIDGKDVDLATANPEVAAQYAPAQTFEVGGRLSLCDGTPSLSFSRHG